jgi:putative hydrolase of the HAD superfamily
MSVDRPYDVLLLDFGGVCLLTPFELHHAVEANLGLPLGSLTWMGPFDTATDTLWRELFGHGEELNERLYWQRRAELLGQELGRPMSTHDYMRLAFEPSGPHLIRPIANEVIAEAQVAGLNVSVLTNDLTAFHGPDWQIGIPMLQKINQLIDCSHTGILKPDKRAYDQAIELLGVPAERILFVDDQPLNVAGAQAAGLATHWLDVTNANESWLGVLSRLELTR